MILIEVPYITTGKKIILVDKVTMVMVIAMAAGSLVHNSTNLKVNLLIKLNLLLKEFPVVLIVE